MPENKLKAILFDLEMTLFDSSCHKLRSVELAVQSMIEAGLNLEEGEAKNLLWEDYTKSFHGSSVISDFLKNHNYLSEDILNAGIKGYQKVWEEETKSYLEVKETLIQLKSLGLRLAIVTDAPLNKAMKRIEALDLMDFFEVIVAPTRVNDGVPRKPSPEPFMKALNKMGLKPEETAYVGDWMERDIQGANGVGMTSIHAKYGDILSSGVYKGKPAYVINAFNELLGVVYTINQKT